MRTNRRADARHAFEQALGVNPSLTLARIGAAACVCRDALTGTGVAPGAGWVLSIEPLLDASTHRDAWAAALMALEQRAS